MQRHHKPFATFLLLCMICSCGDTENKSMGTEKDTAMNDTHKQGSFGYDVNFVSQRQKTVVLRSADGKRQVLVCPEYQGRVLTSTANGMEGKSFGWMNYERIASDKVTPHLQAYGGEDRFWIGPQGGQYTIFFNPGDPFDFDHWFTPAPFDTEPFDVTQQSDTAVRFKKFMKLKNYSNANFDVGVEREVRLLSDARIQELMGISSFDSVAVVGFESVNTMKNAGNTAWKKETGLLSVWILGMFPANSSVTAIIPTKAAQAKDITQYFVPILGQLPPDRLQVKNGTVYYKADGNYCSKIGVRQAHAKDVFGSYDASNNILTIVQYSLPTEAQDYVNSLWEIQREPYNGDVVNSYNDGSLDRKPLPKPTFYELESSSPAKALQPNEGVVHTHRTFHLQGSKSALNAIAIKVLGASLDELK